jgi:signal peptidase
MKTLATICYALFTALLLGVVGLLLFSFLPIPGNIEVKIVQSGSMEPTIQTGGAIVIKPYPSYRMWDVITFGEDTQTAIPTTHRIVDIEERNGETFFLTKGDANEESDSEWVAESEVIGAVVFDMPYAGYVLDFARQPVGFVLLVVLPAGVIIVEEMVRIVQEIRTLRRGRRRNIPLYETR